MYKQEVLKDESDGNSDQVGENQLTINRAAVNGKTKALTLNDLEMLKYVSQEEATVVKIRIINEASHKWKDIAGLICSDANRIKLLEQQYRGDPKECLQQIFIESFIENKPQKYSRDWNGLIELLGDVDLEALAEKVETALSYNVK